MRLDYLEKASALETRSVQIAGRGIRDLVRDTDSNCSGKAHPRSTKKYNHFNMKSDIANT